ncbi:energy-coupling factor ABC transporter permease [Conchiformibius kuhniae]|uniref:Energy-coupling factor ABC transporter permease n=1 Tax=Conchiformibius kuhniae TaxID=211502 RepID=A0ABD8B725_9NEIS|nr:energy-coupling factor ABC transporter permease [Conchiformibius kuhniae]
MNADAAWFSWQVLAGAAVLCLGLTAWCAPAFVRLWRGRADLLGAGALVSAGALLAQVPAGYGGAAYHLLGVNLACLMLGGRAAWCVACFWLLVAETLRYGTGFVAVWPLQSLLTVLPAWAVGVAVRRIGTRYLPPNVFVYIFVYGFLAAAAGMLLTGVLAQYWHGAAVLRVFVLLAWGEAFLSGLFAAILLSFAPRLLATFSDEVYLKRDKDIWTD